MSLKPSVQWAHLLPRTRQTLEASSFTAKVAVDKGKKVALDRFSTYYMNSPIYRASLAETQNVQIIFKQLNSYFNFLQQFKIKFRGSH
jgi:hypothetical protein